MKSYKEPKLSNIGNDDEILDYVYMVHCKSVKESEKFNKEKKYIFDLETALKDGWTKQLYESGRNKSLMDFCNGQEVDIIDEYNGRIELAELTYIISPRSCKKVE